MAIERLPQAVADAIAAGEVVERPASVVKELCENAVDAGAHRVQVVVEGAGTTRILVVDDGGGIPPGELPLALARHATSKIRSASDLEMVATLGFRGEALASIAAVADVTLSSRVAGERSGGRLRVRHGTVVEEGSWAGPAGTTVEVLDLFAATPARLRFLRRDRAEAAASLAVVSDLVLTHPELAVSCVVDGRRRLQSPGGSLDDALVCVFGSDAAELLAVAAEGDINVGGAISEPRRHRGSRAGLVLVVNGRRVHNRALLAAVDDAYRGLIPTGRHGFGVVSVALDPAEVDVNVHPTKREVRFRDERGVFAAVQRACWAALQRATVYGLGPAAGHWLALGEEPAGGEPAAAVTGVRVRDAPGDDGRGDGGDGGELVERPGGGAAVGTFAEEASGGGRSVAELAPLRALGQHEGRWLLASSARGIVIVDPHAAHEKVLYTDLLTTWRSGSAGQQILLIPELVDCDARTLELYEAHQEVVAECGFVVAPFGPATLRCSAVPVGARVANPGRLLRDLLDTLAGGPVSEQRHRAAALIACHSAVRFGDELGGDAQQHLLDRLSATSGGVTCPHGRPALTLLEEPALRRIFRRPAP